MHEPKSGNSELLMATNFFVSILVVAIVSVSLSAPDALVDGRGVGLNSGMPDAGGAGSMAGLSVMIAIPLLVIFGSIGYGVLSVAAWMRAREALPRMSIALAWINFFILAVATSKAVSTGKTVSQCAGFVALAITALTVCLSLRVSRRPVAPPMQPN